ncbi:ATP-binding protein [Methylomonas sp. ZR1]|uniref:ATP-binding protein n=1 Tax=Methylomonas sp. ZR1 TaxID=1797072 RepID=UPI001491850E|nr:ATP-binding protein [Methylomonas sp. ZR1]NOV30055.1 hypothetical protein [Methylomonas sp. ZR1]
MDLKTFEKLINLNEKDFIDFKSEMYFSNSNKNKDKARAEFVKDIISMWNTPRETNAYIILGVKKGCDNNNEFIGIDFNNIPDDADLRSQFDSLVSYTPSFDYDFFNYNEKNFVIFTIPIANTISVGLKDFYEKTLKKDALYYREGSKNTEALKGSRKEEEIYRWFREKDKIFYSGIKSYTQNEILLSAMGDFDSDKYYYFLITSPLSNLKSDSLLQNFGFVNWTFVVDFDPDSQNSGLLSSCKDNLVDRQSLNIIVKGETPAIHASFGTYWYFASGLSGRNETLLSNQQRITWLKEYSGDFRRQVERISKAIGNAKPIKVLMVLENGLISDYLTTILDSLVSTYQDNVSFIVVSPEKYSSIESIVNNYGVDFLQMPLLHLCQTFENCQKVLDFQKGSYSIPSSTGTAISIEKQKIPWLKEELEIVHLGVGDDAFPENINYLDFLRGHEISWGNLKYRHDVDRDETVKLERLIIDALRNRRHLRINLYHIPGAGGTTVARRILWNQHKEYPCIVLQDMKDPLETMIRLSHVADISQSAVLLLIDGGLISDRQADALYEKIASSYLPVVILQVLRKFDLPSIQKASKNTRTLSDKLSKNEKDNFYYLLSKEISSDKLNQLKEEVKKDCTPFSLGFLMFGDDYQGIDNYVKYRLDNIGDAQKRIVIFLSIAYYYGQRSISPNWFHKLLNISATLHVELDKAFDSRVHDLIVYDEIGRWRISHVIFARKCLSYLFSPEYFGNNNFDHIWKQGLSTWAKEFVVFCRGNLDAPPSDESIELMCRVFYFRDNDELLGTEKSSFSNFIEDINDDNGKLAVFRYLTEMFPGEPQFWAHLGRFYSVIKKDFDEAVLAIDRALDLNDNDPLIHHMKGMAIRNKLYNLIYKDKLDEKEFLAKIVQEAEKASLSFAKNRELNPIDEHGYISEVQMIIKILNHAAKYFNNNPIDAITFIQSPKWLRESLENASYLLDQVRRIRQEDHRSRFEANCQAELDVIYGNVEDALQKWNILLDSEKIAPFDKLSIRRSIIYTRLKQVNHKWADLNPKHINRIVELLEDNLRQGKQDKDLSMWLDAIRILPTSPHLDEISEKISYWKINTNSIDSIYYLYILQVLQVMSGSLTDFGNAEASIKECHDRSRYRRKNEICFEWLGNGSGVKQLIHRENLGDWHDGFWTQSSALKRLNGVIASIEGAAKGYIEIEGTGLKAFFVPGQNYKMNFFENRKASFYLGFSYSGLRAWEVKEE